MGQEIEAEDGSGGIPALNGCPRGGVQTLRRSNFGLQIGVKTREQKVSKEIQNKF